ncbi:asparagine synthase (glutamine-hydrolyzing) [Caenispirillum salinarum]|uniref:asparagine synthase (glutamine-hydrolyzing) n=1 Tax=Caenispirillum salinarum TaxID=859058 RepID=UPI00384D19FE
MCGIAGFLDRSTRHGELELRGRAAAMGRTLLHRGPDGGDEWTDAEAGIALAHRRLAIVDLSPAGHQPMVSADGRLVVSYNGEVYNAPELREELEAAGVGPFRGHSDTEVIVEGCRLWGVEATARRLIGMFAFAVWDKATRCLWLVRDRLGIKPLYWAHFGGLTIFGSELKALRAQADWTPEIDRAALAAYMRYGYVPSPGSIYKGVNKLPPGHILCVRPDAEKQPELSAFWTLRDTVAEAERNRLDTISDSEATDRLEGLLGDAVRRRMVADVPLGAFLSGGIDSSVVTALMQAASERPVRTFTIGFAENDYNEAQHAKAVAEHLGTEHTELYISPDEARDVIPRLAHVYDEPFADSSQIPTILLSAMTRQHVTVALSGDGGDELFAGYTRYALTSRMWDSLSRVPAPVRALGAGGIRAVPPATWQRLFDLLPDRLRPFAAGDRLHKLAGLLPLRDRDAVYRYLISQWHDPAALCLGQAEALTTVDDPGGAGAPEDVVERLQYLDTLTYLPDDILTKVDRASMAASLEARVPILDHRVAAFAWQLPGHLKMRDGKGKWLLREVLYRHVPRELIERPKMGFGVPIAEWLRGPLRDWADDLLNPRQLAEDGLLDPALIRAIWDEHQSCRRNWQYRLWAVLMFQSWKRAQDAGENSLERIAS